MENTHLAFCPGVSGFGKNTYGFEKTGIRLAGYIDEARRKYRWGAPDI